MRHLGIDYGTKRVGLAISDENGKFAMPFSVLQNSSQLIEEIEEICATEGIGKIVVGESRDFSMKENPIMKKVHLFVEKLEDETGLPVMLEPEVLSTLQASRVQGEGKLIDASAAAIILKSFLDRQKND